MKDNEPKKIICGICRADMGESEKEEGELSYDGCEEGTETWRDD